VPKERFKIPFAAYLIVRNASGLLLSLRRNTGFMDGYYGLVSGHIDGGEPASLACVREAREEAGIRLSPAGIRPVHVMHRLSTLGQEYVDFYFMADGYAGPVRNAEPSKCAGLDFFKESGLPDNTIPYVRFAIGEALAGVFYSEYGFGARGGRGR
jgi:8-oxo-dGTP pyrophosphatase MutT (NUDIX family)